MAGCDEDWAKQLEFGTRYPDARIEVTLKEPTSQYRLYRRLEEAAHAGGFFDLRGRPVSEQDIGSQSLPRSYYWFPKEGSDHSSYRIRFMWPRGAKRPPSFAFVFYNSSTKTFTEREWRKFFKWKDSYLPSIFPSATIEITQHPAEFTNDNDLLRISRVTGIPLPERYKKDAADF